MGYVLHSLLLFSLIGGVKHMITINLGTIEYYDSDSNQFVYDEGGIVRFEYSLKAVYHWESKWRKPFLKGGLSEEESIDFYMTMALDPIDKKFMSDEVMDTLSKYIRDSDTATTFSTPPDGQNGNKTSGNGKVYTAEELYALMFMKNIPLVFEERNLNRLLIILKVIQAYNDPPKKMSQQDIMRQNAELNRQRREQMKTKG